MAFPNFSSINLASQRASIDLDIVRNITKGNCMIPLTNDGINKVSDTYSIVRDNYIYYSLTRTCLGLKYKNVTINGDRVTFTFSTAQNTDRLALTYLMLLNPVFCEFSFNQAKTTVAYYPIFHNDVTTMIGAAYNAEKVFRYSTFNIDIASKYGPNKINTDDPSITFEVVLPLARKGEDSLFNYFTDANPFVRVQDLSYPPYGIVNVSAFYLDNNIPTSYQNIGKMLARDGFANLFSYPPLLTNNNNDLVVFDTNYVQKYSQNQNTRDIYEFNNNINVFFKNNVQPVFTVCYDVKITGKTVGGLENQNIVISRMFMDNDFGNYTNCDQITQELGKKNNNMFMVVLEIGQQGNNGYNLSFVTGRGGSCNYRQNSNDQSNLTLPLPYLMEDSTMRIIFTITPNEKIACAIWNDPMTTSIHTSVARSSHCSDDLNIAKLFKDQARPFQSANIKMNTNATFVQTLRYISLGYPNLLTEYLTYI